MSIGANQPDFAWHQFNSLPRQLTVVLMLLLAYDLHRTSDFCVCYDTRVKNVVNLVVKGRVC